MVFLRLFSTTELDQLSELLPSVNISVQSAKGKAEVKEEDGRNPAEKRQRQLRDQYISFACTVPFAKVPCVMDIVTIIGDSNSAMGGKLLHALCAMKQSACKEVADAIRESIKVGTRTLSRTTRLFFCECAAEWIPCFLQLLLCLYRFIFQAMDQVRQSFIVLSRRILDGKHARGSSGKAGATKVSGLSVLSLERKPSGSDKSSGGSKLTSAEELLFLCEFAADIVYTLQGTLAAIQHAQLAHEVANILW
jgi:hypothetical protein